MTRAARSVASPRVVCVEDFRPIARQRIPKPVFDYLDGGAEGEVTLRENCRIFNDVTFRPRHAVALADIEWDPPMFPALSFFQFVVPLIFAAAALVPAMMRGFRPSRALVIAIALTAVAGAVARLQRYRGLARRGRAPRAERRDLDRK